MSDLTICLESSRVRIRQGSMMTYQMHNYSESKHPAELPEIGQYLQEGKAPDHYTENKRKILTIKAAPYTFINGNLYRLGLDDILRQCALEHERKDIIQETHSGAAGGHFSVDTTIKKILQ